MTSPPAPPPPPPASPPVAARRADGSTPLPSEALLQGRRTIEISHNGAVYRLQATKLGKLILTK
ncbi:hemin uptake protein HemP [Ottowia pentelensis]|uniref:hemin uptake protein HemP n=1 Tax=Ottowia pentelensis TaxID=511108 RepID=UPI00361442D9